VLTEKLFERAKHLVAIEKDKRLCEYLRRQYPGLDLIHGDAVDELDSQFAVQGSGFKVVSNLPYSISTPILERLVEGNLKPSRIVVTLQREVAQRLAAQPRTKDYGALTLFTQLHYHCTVAHVVSSGCFYPSPHVESAIVVLDRRDPRVKLKPGALFHKIVRTGFGQRRKMLKKLVTKFGDVDAAFAATSLSPTARAEELSLEQWIALTNALVATAG
jgi:16S rRNA (adenine1518-N6/adenine1519-N6)-dimethyltransferase